MGIAVFGLPADAVNVALMELGIVPHLVVSGVNSGQNVGPFAAFSGTVGAARTAARAGYPAVAVSASFNEFADYDAAAALVVAWIEENRDALAEGTAGAERVTSFNVPGCTAGAIRELVRVPLADSVPEGANPFFTDCSVEPESAPVNDVDAIIKGYAAETQVPLEL
jgi:5'-nucleotidase